MPGLLHQAHQDEIERKRREITGESKLKCIGCGKHKDILTNQGLCYECLYIDSHYLRIEPLKDEEE